MKLGDAGPAVAEVRARLTRLGYLNDPEFVGIDSASAVDTVILMSARFDADLDTAVRAFQQDRGISVDGIIGRDTFRHLEEARWRLGDRVLSFTPGHLISGDDVAELQRRLIRFGFDCGRADGWFGRQTDAAVREFQRSVGVEADGTCGPDTFKAFDRLSRAISSGAGEILREQISFDSIRTGVADKVIVIDPGHGGHDDGVALAGLAESDVAYDIATRVEGRVAALGTQVVLTRSALLDHDVDEIERADFANHVGADLVVSIHLDASPSPAAQGVVSFYYGQPGGAAHSIAGRVFAEMVQEEVCGRTEALDCHSHPRNWDLLRRTRMPAVRVEVGYLTNADDAARLADSTYRDQVAEGIAAAIVRFFSPEPR